MRLDAAVDNELKITLRVYPLKDIRAGPTAKILRDIFPADQYKTLRLSVSEQTNSIVVAGSVPDLVAIESLIVRLEAMAKDKKAEKSDEKR